MVKTGKGPISIMVVIAIWALSLGVDLPGLAVTPMLDSLNKIFGHVSQLEVQMLTVLPNLVIIPFVLLSGKLSMSKHKIAIVVWSLIIYLASGILYLFSKTMIELIVISCLLGVGCGLLIPFSTGLVADVFVGKYRMKQMGIISAIGNIALMVATLIVGVLASHNWHYPFLVYLIPIVPLLLVPWLNRIPKNDLGELPAQVHQDDDTEEAQKQTAESGASTTTVQNATTAQAATAPAASKPQQQPQKAQTATATAAAAVQNNPIWPTYPGEKITGGFYLGRTIWLMAAYFFFVYASTCPSLYMSYLMASDGSTAVGIVTCVFYAAMFVVGIFLTPILKAFRKVSFIITILFFIIGSLGMILFKNAWLIGIGYAIMGLGNGIAQPIFYDKATEIVTTNNRSTLALAILLAANYLAISAAPEIVDFFAWIFRVDVSHNPYFPFWLNLVGCVVILVLMIVRVNHFVFGIKKEYYE